ncbi:hypothetical protein [uncultured Croceicoccus sp.]|uniref:hypothetical protein n=1 Tax=uncultured Croceicoccus sp. TaxID=1295329 RepID=UPI00261F6929|nr:hypothetical protein [uncultured Croceicoccus sp.]
MKRDEIDFDGIASAEADASLDLGHRIDVVEAAGRALRTPAQAAGYRALRAQDALGGIGDVAGHDLRTFMGRLPNFLTLRARISPITAGLSRDAMQPELARLSANVLSPSMSG